MRAWLDAIRSLFALSGRVLWGHWPQLLGIFLLGAAGRHGFLWLAVWASNHSAKAGLFILPLAPLSTLLSLVLMLRVVMESLPAFRDRVVPGSRWSRLRSDLTIASQVMLPFLALYYAQELLAEDSRAYVHDINLDEFINKVRMSAERVDYASGWELPALIAAALLLRWAIAMSGLGERIVAVAALAAYVEALWMVSLLHALKRHFLSLAQWFGERVVVQEVLRIWSGVVEWAGPVGKVLAASGEWLVWFLGSSTMLLVVPVAWLILGASIYEERQDTAFHDLPSAEELQRRIGVRMRRWMQLPHLLERFIVRLLNPVIEPFAESWTGIQRVLSTGAVVTTVFCIAFMGLNMLQVAVAHGVHLLVGPRPVLLRMALIPYMDVAVRAVYFVLSMAVLAAAVNAVSAAQRAARPLLTDPPRVGTGGTAVHATTGAVPPGSPRRAARR